MKLGGQDIPSYTCRMVGDILGQIGNKWSILVMVLLSSSPWTFNALRREIGVVTQKVLTSTLRGLERDGYIGRTVLPGKVIRVEYRLTQLGRDALKPMNALAAFALHRQAEVLAARAAYDDAKRLGPEEG
ncbi:helix-turn-helix domain-containing protein [Niveibacterium sp. SC-1]|uniref:winged helix-turn-helix transcriptional regulator n=1 Tax=Niveibacterium sp. SC-1 TaxID=3135646 RepID=UPI00311FF655